MRPTEHFANSASTPKSALFAMLGGLLRTRGRSTPTTVGVVVSVFAAALGVLACVSAPALAAAPLPEVSVTDVASSSVTLHAVLNPEGGSMTYRFEYGPSTAYGSETPEGSTGAAPGPVNVEFHVQGLSAATVYHFRVLASNAAHETSESEDQTFTTQPSGGVFALPDSRQWEMVSPPDKHGALIEPITFYGLIQSSTNGSAFTYITSSPTEAEPPGNANAIQVLATRSPSGWSSKDIATRNETSPGITVGNGQEYRFFSPDLSRSLFESRFVVKTGGFTTYPGEETSPYATEATPYMREDFTCQSTPATCYTPVLTETDVTSGAKFGENFEAFEGATPDLSHVVLTSPAPLTKTTPEAVGGGLYEWTAGQLQLVSILPKEEGGGPSAGFAYGTNNGYGDEARNAISDDGSRIVWSTTGEGGGLYMRDTASGETVRLDAVQGGSGANQGRVQLRFNMASSDGSEVFFTDTQNLTVDSRGGEKEGPDLYVCQVVEVEEGGHKKLKCDLTDLTPDTNPDGEAADVQGAVLDVSEDGSYVYFVANGVLGDGAEHGATPGDCKGGQHGRTCNLYVEHYNGSEWEAPVFIAALAGADVHDWSWGSLGEHTSRSSPDGRYLAFMSERDLTGYDTADAVSGEPDEEVYLYHAEVSPSGRLEPGKLVCASCNPTGARPVGEVAVEENSRRFVGGYSVWEERWLAANVPGWTPFSLKKARYQSRYLSDSGRLFFNSHEALVPQDVNGTWDVYEYEPPGVGTCTTGAATFSERSGGCVGLISSGESAEESAFFDASENGGDVFFATLSQLVPQDYDHSMDVYDAHECTTEAPCFPAPVEVPPPCTTEASCRPSPTPQPAIYGPPPSATFNGTGNVPPPPVLPAAKPKAKPLKCKQGTTKAHDKCVKKKSSKKAKKAKKASNDRRASR